MDSQNLLVNLLPCNRLRWHVMLRLWKVIVTNAVLFLVFFSLTVDCLIQIVDGVAEDVSALVGICTSKCHLLYPHTDLGKNKLQSFF